MALEQAAGKDIQRTIARVCAYPVGMLTGAAEATQLVLEARSGLRLSEMMGALRGLPTEVVPEAPLQYSNTQTGHLQAQAGP